MLISDLEKKYPWTSHSLVRIFAECFSESEWDAIHTAGLEELIQTNFIIEEGIVFLLSNIYQVKTQNADELQLKQLELDEAVKSGDSSSAEMLAEMEWKPGDTIFSHLVTAQIKELPKPDTATEVVPKIKTLLATGFSKEILDAFLSVSINPREEIQYSFSKEDTSMGGILSNVTFALALLTTDEEAMPYSNKKNALKMLFERGFIPCMLKSYSHLDLSPGKLHLFARETLTYEFFSRFCNSGTTGFFKPNPSEEEYKGFAHMFTQLSNFYDHLTERLDATHEAPRYYA